MSFELDRLFHLAVSGAGDTGFPGSVFHLCGVLCGLRDRPVLQLAGQEALSSTDDTDAPDSAFHVCAGRADDPTACLR